MTQQEQWHQNAKTALFKEGLRVGRELRKLQEKIGAEETIDSGSYYPPKAWFYWVFITGGYLFLQFGIGLLVAISPLMHMSLDIGLPINPGLLIIGLQIIHFFKSFTVVGVDELAGFLLFGGKPLHSPKAGLYLTPKGIVTVVRAVRPYKDVRFPGQADQILRLSSEQQRSRPLGDAPEPGSGMVRPVIVMTGSPKFEPENGGETFSDPLDRQLAIEVSWFIRYRVNQDNGGIFRIIRNLTSEPGEITTKIEDLMREQSERDLREVLATQTPATIIQNIGTINGLLLQKMRLAFLRLGVEIGGGGIDDVNLSHETNEAQANAARAVFEKRRTILNGEAAAEVLRLTEEAGIKGRAQGLDALMKTLDIDGATALSAEVTVQALNKADVFVAGTDGVKDLVTIGKAAGGFLKGDK